MATYDTIIEGLIKSGELEEFTTKKPPMAKLFMSTAYMIPSRDRIIQSESKKRSFLDTPSKEIYLALKAVVEAKGLGEGVKRAANTVNRSA